MISLLKQDHSIVLDFPHKNSVFFEDYSSDRADLCKINILTTQQDVFSQKLFTDWKFITPNRHLDLKNLSFSNNFLFKGNNLLVLHSIISVFRNSVKLIYIDPPYNTGNSFIYKDKLSRATWLLFMKN
ncbi:MAG: site-specific DNA-methyltransferase, partial [Brevinema sp.]